LVSELRSYIFSNRQEIEVAKDTDKIAKKPWRHRENLVDLRGLAVQMRKPYIL